MRGPTKRSFDQLFKLGWRTSGRWLRIYSLPGNGRVGIATPRSLGNQPRRAKVKRQIREIVRAMNVDWLTETDLAIALKASVDRVPFLDLQSDLVETMAKVRARLEDALESS